MAKKVAKVAPTPTSAAHSPMVNPKNNVVAEAAYTALDASAATPFSTPTAIASSVFTVVALYARTMIKLFPLQLNVGVIPEAFVPTVGMVLVPATVLVNMV